MAELAYDSAETQRLLELARAGTAGAVDRLQLGLLDYVGRIDAGPQLGVQAQLDEAADIRAVPLQEAVQGPGGAGTGLFEQALRLGRIVGQLSHAHLPGT